MSLRTRLSSAFPEVGSPEDIARIQRRRDNLGANRVEKGDDRFTLHRKGLANFALDQARNGENTVVLDETSQDLAKRADEAHETGEFEAVKVSKRG